MLKRLTKTFASLRLTVALLSLGIMLVFLGTLAQVHEGLYDAQTRYFKSWFVSSPTIGHRTWPIVLPGGYLIGTLLLVNLLGAHATRFKLEKRKFGIFLIHGGVVLLLAGQLATDMFQVESQMRLTEGQAKNYSESGSHYELAVVDKTDPETDNVLAIPERLAAQRGEIRHRDLPFTLRVIDYFPNS